MKAKAFILLAALVVLLPVQSNAVNLIVNGDFAQPMSSGWDITTNVSRTNYCDPFTSPSGDNSYFACLLSNSSYLSPRLMQTVDLPNWDNITLSADLLLATYEDPGDWPSNDVFRAQIEIGQLGQGWSSIYSRGSGEGGFSDYNPVTHPGLRYYDLGAFTYDLSAWKGTDDFILSFLIDGRGTEDSYLLADNIRIDAVPEPSTFLLTGLGLAVLGFYRSRRRQ